VEGLEAIIVTDSDGVLILEVSTKDFPQNMLKSNYLAMFGIATEKGSKLGFGTNKTISAFYSGHQVHTCTSSFIHISLDVHSL
jgi:mitogen-activated protein kinase kinase 1 interacting protein 1